MDILPVALNPLPAGGKEQPKGDKAPSAWWLAAAALVAFAILRLPREGLTAELDDSWRGVLDYAHERGWQFGSDIVFTYGPLGFLTNFKIGPGRLWMRILFEVAMSLGVALGLGRLAARMNPFFRVLLPGFFVLASATIQEGRDDLFFDTVLVSWGLLCCLESGPRRTVDALCLTAFAVIGALSKFTWLLTGGLTVAFAVGNFWLRGRRRLAAGVLAGYGLIFLASWILLGQKLSGLLKFVQNSTAISSGYNSSMAVTQVGWKTGGFGIAAVFAVALFSALTGSRCGRMEELKNSGSRRALLFFWTAGLLFMQWKHGMVRADEPHTTLMLVFAPAVALMFEAVERTGRVIVPLVRAAEIAGVLFSVILLQHFFPGFCQKSLRATAAGIYHNASALVNPPGYARECAAVRTAEETKARLPGLSGIIGHSSVDVFGCAQQVAIYNQWNYHPRPVFQNYSVYSRPLSELNERFYAAPTAPEFVLFHLQPIDERFPPLEDPLVLRQLLVNYDLAGEDEKYLLLRRTRVETPRLTLLKEGQVKTGEPISLREYDGTNLWLEVEIKPNLAGRLAGFACKLTPPGLRLEMPDSMSVSNYTAPPLMLSSGFLASPLLLNDEDARNFYAGNPLRRPASFSIALPGAARFWQDGVHYRIFRIENIIARRKN